MGIWSTFETESRLEKDGVPVEYGDTRVTLARSGGANRQYTKVVADITRPYRRAIDLEEIPPEKAEALLMEAFSVAVVRNWETNIGTYDEPQWVSGILPEGVSGVDISEKKELLPYNRENVLKTLKKLPDLYADMAEMSRGIQLYRKETRDNALGN